eukprot:gene8026-12346_t
MGNHCMCVRTEDDPLTPMGEGQKGSRDSAGNGKERRNPKCVAAIIADINAGLTAIPIHGGASWDYRTGCNSAASGSLGTGDMQRIAHRLASPHQLKRLELVSRGFGDAGAAALAQAIRLPSCRTLSHLSISHNNIADDGFADVIDALRDNVTLKTLHCDGNSLSSGAIEALGECLQENSGLEVVELCVGTEPLPVTAHAMRTLGAGLASNVTLKSFTLSGEHCRQRRGDRIAAIVAPKEASEFFSRLTENKTLQELHFRYLLGTDGAGIREACAQCAAFVLQSDSLRLLDFTGNLIGDSGGGALASCLGGACPLATLVLCKNRLADGALTELGAALGKNRTLRKVDLSNQFALRAADGDKTAPNPGTAAGMLRLITGLYSNRTLCSLHVTDLAIEGPLVEAVKKLLQLCTSLTDLRHAETDMKVSLALGELLQKNIELQTTAAAAALAVRAAAPPVERHSSYNSDSETPSEDPGQQQQPQQAPTEPENARNGRKANGGGGKRGAAET